MQAERGRVVEDTGRYCETGVSGRFVIRLLASFKVRKELEG